MIFEMPEEISGQKNRSVLCQGRVIRCEDQAKGSAKESKDQDNDIAGSTGLLAASIVDYKFIR
jgi:hypothetical protein